MNQAEYENVSGGLMQLARDIEDSKRPGYTRGADDVLANFKRVSERLGITPEQAWGTYFLKHIDAILSIMTQPDLAVSEEPAGRFADAINYLRLGYALLRERDPLPVAGFDDYIPRPSLDVICSGAGGAVPNIDLAPAHDPINGSQMSEIPHGEGGFGFTLPRELKMGPHR